MKDLLVGFWNENSALIIKIGYKILLALLVFFAIGVLGKAIAKFIKRTNRKMNLIDETLIPVFCTISVYLIYAVGLVIVLDIFGVNTTSIIALLGAAGLAVGLALKDTLSNIAAGIMLLILRPFRVGDAIECGSVKGSVREINLFATILDTFDGLYVSTPNGGLWGNTIINFTRNGKRRMDIVVGISYSDSIETGLEVLRHIIKTEPRFLKEPEPQAMVIALGDSSINLQLRCWTLVVDYWQTLWELNKRIKEDIEKAGLSIPFPQRDVHLYPVPLQPPEEK